MAITPKKNQYALRAIFELAKHMGKGPKKISEIAKAQAIPMRFLEVILGQLKGSGWYLTDYANRSSNGAENKSNASGSSEKETKTKPSTEANSTEKSTESKA